MKDFPEIYKLAIEAAILASNRILEIYQTDFSATLKQDGSPVTNADLASSQIICGILEQTNIPIVDEEKLNLDFEQRKNWQKNWCVDPLDGTKEFIKKNGEFAVNIALVSNYKPVFGLIAYPVEKLVIAGGEGLGVHIFSFESGLESLDSRKLENTAILEEKLVWIGSRSHFEASEKWLGEMKIQFSCLEKITKGSAIKFFDLAMEKAHCYPRFGPTMEWDIAAGHAILKELGGTVVTLESGEELVYNKESLFNPNFVAKTNAFLQREKKFSTLRSL